MDGCHVYNCRGVGVFLDRVNLHQALIGDSHISYCKGGGIKVEAGEIRNLQIVGNDIEYNHDVNAAESADVWIDAADGSIREGTIAGNTIQALYSPGGANVRLRGPADVNKVGMWAITGNHVGNQEVNVHLVNCRGVVLSGNSLAVSRRRSILIEGARQIVVGPHSLDRNPDYKGEIVDGVSLRDCEGVSLTGVMSVGSAAGSDKEGGAIELYNCRETTLTGCQVFEPKWRGVYVAGGRNTVITGCTVLERTGNGTMLVPVHFVGRPPGTQMTGNRLGGGKLVDLLQE
jgi:parallel beta-helix repeat protein